MYSGHILIKNKTISDYTCHNLSHTQRVVKSTKKLIEGKKIAKKDAEQLIIAAWFHDVGYILPL